MKALIAGNWKMNGLLEDRGEIEKLAGLIAGGPPPACEILLCLPFTLLFPAVKFTHDTPIQLGAQDCHQADAGAHTGDISAAMIAEAGCSHVIVGHSERRSAHGAHGERSEVVREKARAAYRHGMSAIICIGENLDEREAGRAKDLVLDQLKKSLPREASSKNTVIAYEPIWAIGTGRTATPGEIAEMHGILRTALEGHLGGDGAEVQILYGGSVNPGNAKEILATGNVNGALVGGASLKADDFYGIIQAVG